MPEADSSQSKSLSIVRPRHQQNCRWRWLSRFSLSSRISCGWRLLPCFSFLLGPLISFDPFPTSAVSPILLTLPDLFAAGNASATGSFATLCQCFFTSICLAPFSLDNCHTTPISSSPRQVRYTLQLLEDDYASQHSVSPLGIYKKQLQ